jgi:hypothetical protein
MKQVADIKFIKFSKGKYKSYRLRFMNKYGVSRGFTQSLMKSTRINKPLLIKKLLEYSLKISSI